MAGQVKHAKLESPTSRSRLKRGREAHWQALIPGQPVHLGYQVWKGKTGRWLLRRYTDGKYSQIALGPADDAKPANGLDILSYAQVQAKARSLVEAPGGAKIYRVTVRQAMDLYVEHKKAIKQSVVDVMSRGTVHILPLLGDHRSGRPDRRTIAPLAS